MKKQIGLELEEHLKVIKELGSDKIEKAVQMIVDCYKNNGKVVLFGNGGSAADAQHIAAEFVGEYKLERKSLPAIALTTNTSIMSAVGNDYGFERVFERQIESMVESKDIVIGISTSGNSENVIKGILKAKEKGAKTIGFTGRSGGRLKNVVDILLNVSSDSTPRIQEAHITIGHIMCGLVEKELFENENFKWKVSKNKITMSSQKFKTLFIYSNPRIMSLVPPVVALLYRILSDAGIKMNLFDTSLYDASKGMVNADDYDKMIMAVKPYQKELEEKVGELNSIDNLVPDLQEKVRSFSPDLIMATVTESTFLYTIDLLKKIKHFNVPVLLGGVFATFASDLVIKYDEIDMLCIGEAENIIVSLCECLAKGKDPSGMQNLWVKKKDGSIVKGPLAPPVDINKNPLPDMSIFDDRRFYRAMAGKIYRMFPVETHRGCPHTCGFCNSPLQNKLYQEKTNSHYFRAKSIPLVMKEIRYYVENFNPEYFFFWADNFFFYPEKEIDEFCEAYSEIKIPFFVQSHPNQLSEHKIKRLKEVGLHRVTIGIEHGNEEFRRNVINRFYSNEQLLEGVRILHKYNVPLGANNICGFPTETPELFMDTVELNRKLNADNNSCSIFTPFYGTPLRVLAVEKGYLKNPDIIAPTNTERSILDMPQFTKEQISGKSRTFNLYVHFPKNRWPEIEKAEKMTPEGNKIWNELRQEYQKNTLT